MMVLAQKRVQAGFLASAAVALLTLAGCDSAEKTPGGQVVARVDGRDVTIHELNAELKLIPNRGTPDQRKLVEAVALARVVERKMLADEAQKRNLDKNPDFLMAKQRTDENLLVQVLQSDIQSKVQATTREAAQKFVADNPQLFGDRKIFTIDQIQFLQPANLDSLPLKAAKSMGEVEKILLDANIEYRRAPQQLDSLAIAPALTTAISKISATANGEPFIFADQPNGAPAPIIYVNNVTSTATKPFIGEKAVTFAQNILQRQEVQKRLASELNRFKESYKSKIVYAKGYGPPVFPKPPVATPAAPDAAAATATATPAATPAPAK